MMKQQLTSWEVKGFWPGEPLWTKSVESTVQRRGVTPWVQVTVPGGVHKAMEKAGLIDDPYVGLNSLKCEWIENRWWVYRTRFATPAGNERVLLRFDGVDDECCIRLNGVEIAAHQGIYEPILCDVTHLLNRQGEDNQLLVVLMTPPREQGQIGWTSKTFTQKARFGYKWDFGTHLVNLGLWRPVWLMTCGQGRIDQVHVTSDVQAGQGVIRVQAKVKGYGRQALVRVSRKGQTVAEQQLDLACPWDPVIDTEVRISAPELWYPNGMGAQPLYDVTITLENGSDEWQGRTGIRSLAFQRCAGAGRNALPYVPVINGQPVYLRGVNMTPLDHRYGDVTREEYRRMFVKMAHMNVNTVRVWGGGLIETEDFYELADEMGLLVWQEFIQSSSGIDNIPSHDVQFLQLLKVNSRAAILEKRNHVSLTWWSGGNELADAHFEPITTGDENIAMLEKLVKELDPQRQFLPSSPSGHSFGLDVVYAEQHDIHGNWQYDGVHKHYEKYNESDAMLQSEFGADGMSSVMQLRRILADEDYCVGTMKEHPVLRHHGEWWETLLYRDQPLFGDIASLPHPMESWVGVSQMMQAEAIRYIVLSNRRRRGQNCGSIIWQVNEPFPNVSCTNLVEYDGWTKAAYYTVRRAYARTALGLRYDSLIQPAGQETKAEVYLDTDGGSKSAQLTLTAYALDGQVLHTGGGEVAIQNGKARMELAYTVAEQASGAYLVRVAASLEDGENLVEDYFFSQREEEPLRALVAGEAPEITLRREGDAFILTNGGKSLAVQLMGAAMDDPHALLCDNALNLLPGESRRVGIAVGKDAQEWQFTDVAGHTFRPEAQ